MELTRQSHPSLPPVSCQHSGGGSTAHSLLPCTCRDTHQKHCLSPTWAAAGVLEGCSRELGKEACKYMLRVALQLQQAKELVTSLAGLDHTQPARCSLQADTSICLPENNRLARPCLVAACEPVGLLAFEALVLLKHAVWTLEKIFAGLQGLVDILQVSQVCSGVCTLLSCRGQELRIVLRPCQSSPGHPGRIRRHKEGHVSQGCRPCYTGHGRQVAELCNFLASNRMLTMRSPKGLQYPGSNFSSSLNVLMPV